MNAMIASLIRTFSPILAGWILSIPLGSTILSWFSLKDTTTTSAAIAAILSALYYTAARLLEQKWPKLGWLLGHASQPSYAPAPSADPATPSTPA